LASNISKSQQIQLYLIFFFQKYPYNTFIHLLTTAYTPILYLPVLSMLKN
jgi:hypothetical protein